ncbi:hypothetical protein PVAND_015768 [Polypedilum vanderplanki]|uniref:Transposase domain-containing protein n=1 Tax=Polypedilum vanderplanki TaxID=319348 RepID=A0A9J6BDU9_POLVA|nr:hypothetical protein PVAND_015768 [Polypedilum vanderplanki]
MKEGYKHDSELTKKSRKKRKKNVIREKNIVSVINDKNNVQSVISNINSSSLKCRDTSDLNTQFPKEQIVSVPVSLNEKIVSWSIKFAISRAAVTSLLHILHDDNESLPLDSRTLLNTPRTLSITSMKPGKFLLYGLEKCLRNVIQQIQNAPDILYLDVFVDGAPIYKDSYENGQIWPILIRVINLNSAIFPICILCGSSKPESFKEFLMPFVKEFTTRSSVLVIVGHTGYNSCPKCHAYGRRVENRTILLETDSPLRTDHEFRLKTDSTHHKNVSIIEQLPNFNMINSVPLDYLHTILLGVMRKMLDLWFDTKSLYPTSIKAKISQKISLLSTYEPKEFQRRLRGLEKMKLWKGNELRTFLLFIGPSALKDYISYEHFQHFLLLHIAITILVDESLCIKFNPIAKDLLYKFVESFLFIMEKKITPLTFIYLLHICDDVIRNGCLDNFSAFKFESYLGKIKSFVKSPHKPVEQIYNRMVELLSFSELGINESAFNYSLKKPLENDTYGKIFINGVLIDGNTTCDSFVQLMNEELVKILRFKMVENEVIAIGQKIENKTNIYDLPIQSKFVNSYVVNNISIQNVEFKLSLFHRKMFFLPQSDLSFCLYPMSPF